MRELGVALGANASAVVDHGIHRLHQPRAEERLGISDTDPRTYYCRALCEFQYGSFYSCTRALESLEGIAIPLPKEEFERYVRSVNESQCGRETPLREAFWNQEGHVRDRIQASIEAIWRHCKN